jgi:hypothetical protein
MHNYNFLVFEMSAKTGENIDKIFYTSISKLPIFEGYSGDPEEIVCQLAQENNEKDKPSFLGGDNSLYNSNGISLESAKSRQIDTSGMNSSQNRGDISLKSTGQGEQGYHDFKKRKDCKC